MRQIVIRQDRVFSGMLSIITALLAVLAVELWNQTPPMAPAACAQIPDTALQRKQLLDEARETNRILQDILEHLRAKTIKVKLASPDKEK